MTEDKKYLDWRKKISISQKKRWDEIRQVAEFKFARELLLERYKGLKRVSDLKYLIFELELEYKSQVLIRKHESFLSLLADATRKSLKKSNKSSKRVTKMADKSKLFVCVLCDKTWYGVGK